MNVGRCVNAFEFKVEVAIKFAKIIDVLLSVLLASLFVEKTFENSKVLSDAFSKR